MKKVKLFAVALLIITSPFLGRTQTITEPIDLNNYLAYINDSLYNMGTEWGNALGEADRTKDYSSLIPIRKKMISFIERKKMDILLLKDINQSQNLRLASLEFLFFQQQLVEQAFIPFERLTATSSEKELDPLFDNLDKLANKEEAYLIKLQIAQQKYADDNGFIIETE